MTAQREAPAWLHALLAACGGFLLAVLWFDLMFDVQVQAHPAAPAVLPDGVVASIAAYYARVTTHAHPMQQLIAVVMAVTLLGAGWSMRYASGRAIRGLALLSAAIPIGLAAGRVFPNAVRLGTGLGSLAERSALARGIYADHVFCLMSIALFTALQIACARRRAV